MAPAVPTAPAPPAAAAPAAPAAMLDTPTGEKPFLPELDGVLRLRAKSALRKSLQRVRSVTPAVARTAGSEAIRARLREAGEINAYAGVRAVALFRPIARKGEVETAGIDADARAAGARIAYPAFEEPPFDPTAGLPPDPPEMVFRWVDDAAAEGAFEDRGRGFEEPSERWPPVDPTALDLVVVPALAFDPSGFRIGYGGGHYDRFLGRVARERTRIVGVCFDFQLIVEVPATPGDVPVDMIVTEKRVVRCGER